MNYVNLTPHAIVLNDGRVFEPSGKVARVKASYSEIIDDLTIQKYGEVVDLPPPVVGTRYIVSGMVIAACGDRSDVVAPATGHPLTQRNEKGHIVSVPCFTR